MKWKKKTIVTDNGTVCDAMAPEIISASRSTDIPAFYADWFFHRLDRGYSAWINPFNGKRSYISYSDTRFIVFWSKNPAPLLPYLDILETKGINCYIQYTLNDYDDSRLEPGIPPLQSRIDTFRRLVDRLGKGSVIWRFDPLMLTPATGVDDLLEKTRKTGDMLRGYTEKMVFSFADIICYRKVATNLYRAGIAFDDWTPDLMVRYARSLSTLNSSWHYRLSTCCETVDLDNLGIEHNSCIDDELIIRRAWHDTRLMNFLGVTIHDTHVNTLFDSAPMIPPEAITLPGNRYALRSHSLRDRGQRDQCRCAVSKDIGQYNTCPHQCGYCYANTSRHTALLNYSIHRSNPMSDTIIP